MSRPPYRRIAALLAFVLLLPLLWISASAQTVNGWTTVYNHKSAYQQITILDSPAGIRQMIFDLRGDGTDSIQSEMDLKKPTDLRLAYAKHMITALPLAKNQKHIMVVGLGGACIERFLAAKLPETTIETAEIDPEVVNVARKYFNLNDDDVRQKVIIGDGRKILERSRDKYDVLMLDAFSATSIPYTLSTKEFLQVCKDHLADGGVLVANLWYYEADYHNMLKTYDAVFPEWHVVQCEGSWNSILVALPEKRGLTAEQWMASADAFEKKYALGLNLPVLIDHGYEGTPRIPTDAHVLLDRDEPKTR